MRRSARTRGETLTRNDCQLTLIWLYVRQKVTCIANMQKLIKLVSIILICGIKRAVIYYFEYILVQGYQVVKYLFRRTYKKIFCNCVNEQCCLKNEHT